MKLYIKLKISNIIALGGDWNIIYGISECNHDTMNLIRQLAEIYADKHCELIYDINISQCARYNDLETYSVKIYYKSCSSAILRITIEEITEEEYVERTLL